MRKHRFQYGVEKLCTVMQVSRSGFYKWLVRTPSPREIERKKRKKRIRDVFFLSKKRYGSPRITAVLKAEGMKISSKTVARLMKEMKLKSCMARKYKATTNSNHSMPVHENTLNRKFKVLAPNKVWVTDITYIRTREGWLYLASVMDLFSRKIVGWSTGARMTQELVLDALDMAYKRQKPDPGLLHHSDRGSQYACSEYQKRLAKYKMVGSMSRKGNCYDNSCIESFHSTLKKELVYVTTFKTREQAQKELYTYIEFDYNRSRIHSTLGNKSPHQFEQLYFENLLA
ncbi:IS3 family transposase [Paenibacillus sp. P36]|uniref:IS3 family transposase n=1 Tax=Paenibacillus sp. P36 TaxID=3342538 RepID=UPI0038B357F6